MTGPGQFIIPENLVDAASAEAQKNIKRQIEIVAGLMPGTEHHRVATSVLLLLQDSMALLAETRAMIRAARESSENHRNTKPL